MRNFYMVRHGETTTNLDKIATGQTDVSLTNKGKQQAAKCRDVIQANNIKPDLILCSGLSRTKETADIINQDLKCPIHQHAQINEQSYGDWEGQSWDIVLPEIEKRGENPPNGETQQEFIDRINTAFENLLDQYEGTILFVTHAGVFKSLFAKHQYEAEKVENGVLYELVFSEEGQLSDVSKYKG